MSSNYTMCFNCFSSIPPGSVKCGSCGFAATALGSNPVMLVPGTVLNRRYILGRVLGMGGFGITYLALDQVTGTKCAVKEYLPTQIAVRDTRNNSVLPGNSNDRDLYTRGLALFAKEAQMLSGFRGNRSIVQVWDFFEQNGTSYFVMEFLDGVTLKGLMRSMNGKIPLVFAAEIFGNIGKALGEVHRKGMLHRDVSPENIMITKKGEFKLIDFGATRYFVGENSKSLSVVLKPGFAPPEQYSSRGAQGPWVDVYALAATFYVALSGTPLPDATDRLAGERYPSLHDLEPDVSPAASRAVDKALELNYKQRFQAMRAFLDQLLPPLSGSPASAPGKPDGLPGPALKSTPVLSDIGGGLGRKWILPKNMDMIIGCSSQHCNIIVKIPGGSHVHCTLRYDEKAGCFYVWNLLPQGAFLGDGTPMRQNQVYTLRASDTFSLVSRENLYQVEVV